MQEEFKFETSQANNFAQAIHEAEMNFSRDTICKFLNIPVSEVHPETGEYIPLSLEDAYSKMIYAGYFLNTFVVPVNGKMIFKAQILKPCYEEGIEIQTNFDVKLKPVEREDEEQILRDELEKKNKKRKSKKEEQTK